MRRDRRYDNVLRDRAAVGASAVVATAVLTQSSWTALCMEVSANYGLRAGCTKPVATASWRSICQGALPRGISGSDRDVGDQTVGAGARW